VPGDMLRMIEDAANDDPVQLQTGFSAYDDCSTKSNIYFLRHNLYDDFIRFVLGENDDECVTASEIYSCGREKEPGIVGVIFNTEKGNATEVPYS
jgi:hypothetical protein